MDNNYFLDKTGMSLWVKEIGTEMPVATLSYSIRTEPYTHLYIHLTVSKEKLQGHFNRLYKRVEDIAKENSCKSLRLKTGTGTEHLVIRDILIKKGFMYLPQDNLLDEQRGRIGMERILN